MDIFMYSVTSAIIAVLLNNLFYYLRNKQIQKQTLKLYTNIDEAIKVGKIVIASGIVGEVMEIEENFLILKLEDNQKIKIAKYTVTKILNS